MATTTAMKGTRAELFPTTVTANTTSDRVRFVCISDTHTKHRDIDLPDGDVLLHSGDFTFNGRRNEVEDFADWLKSLTKFRYKVLIAGNHDFTFDTKWYARRGDFFHARDMSTLSDFEQRIHGYFKRTSGHELFTPGPLENAEEVKSLIDNEEMREKFGIYYLEDSGVTITKKSAGEWGISKWTGSSSGNGSLAPGARQINIWGTPWAPDFHGWAFMFPRDTSDLADKYALVPPSTDILICHSPMKNVLDASAMTNENVGCEALKALVDKRNASEKPLAAVVFGHIHEAFGTEVVGETLSINAAMSEQGYKTSGRKPPVFHL